MGGAGALGRAIGPLVRRLARALNGPAPRVHGHRVLVCAGDEAAALRAVDAALTLVDRDAPLVTDTLRECLEGIVVDRQPTAHGVRDDLWHLCRLDADRLVSDPAEATASVFITIGRKQRSRDARHN